MLTINNIVEKMKNLLIGQKDFNLILKLFNFSKSDDI